MHLRASARARSSDRDTPPELSEKRFSAGSRWWNWSATGCRSYSHRAHRPPASATRMALTFRRRRTTESARHFRQAKLPRGRRRWRVVPWIGQSRSASALPSARAARAARRCSARTVASPASARRRRTVAIDQPVASTISLRLAPLRASRSRSSRSTTRTLVRRPDGNPCKPATPASGPSTRRAGAAGPPGAAPARRGRRAPRAPAGGARPRARAGCARSPASPGSAR